MMTTEEHEFYTMIGQVIRDDIRRGDTQSELAEILDVRNTFISGVELGNKKISLFSLFKLLKHRGLMMTTDGNSIQIFKKITPSA